ncbi:MAG: hypothetical protein GX410_04430 [Elusimicrobia bacterium]|nr:hypothetical protein [Elusimicrobiota bacterium]
MRKILFAAPLAAVLAIAAGCASAPQQRQAPQEQTPIWETWDYHPSIERGLEIIINSEKGLSLARQMKTPDGGEMIYGPLTGPWPRYYPSRDRIVLPEYTRDLDYSTGMSAAFGIALRKSYERLGLDDMTVEAVQLAALDRVETALELGIPLGEADKTQAGKELVREICAYIFDGEEAFLSDISRSAQLRDPEYGFPYETLDSVTFWLTKAEKNTGERAFVEAMTERDQDRARRGVITQEEANANALRLTSDSMDNLQKYQRELSFSTSRRINQARRNYELALREHGLWAQKNSALMKTWAEKMPVCDYMTRVIKTVRPSPPASSSDKR